MNALARPSRPYRLGFTLIELLIVITIIGLVTVLTLAAVLPAYRHRGITQAALLVNSVIAGAKDAAVKSNSPHGFRLIKDATIDSGVLTPPGTYGMNNGPLGSSRLVPIELAPDYNEGMVTFPGRLTTLPLGLEGVSSTPPNFANFPVFNPNDLYLSIKQQVIGASGVANSPTEWYWNIRQGDRIRLNDSGRYLPIAGPMQTYTTTGNKPTATNPAINTERFINDDIPAAKNSSGSYLLFVSPIPPSTGPTAPGSGYMMNNNDGSQVAPNAINPEFLLLVNGQDDDGDGFSDNSFDGIDNDNDGLTDPGFNGIDDDGINGIDDPAELFLRIIGGSLVYDTRLYAHRNNYGGTTGIPAGYNPEYEPESTPSGLTAGSISQKVRSGFADQPYTILRRPVPTQGAREIELPAGVVIDLTTANTTAERSRLPVDPNTGAVDILVTSSGSVVQFGPNGLEATNGPFYHFWISEREDVYTPSAQTSVPYLLPMPKGTAGFPNSLDTSGRVLKNEHRLITLFTRTGQVTTNTIDDFDATNTNYGVNRPYIEAQLGLRETP